MSFYAKGVYIECIFHDLSPKIYGLLNASNVVLQAVKVRRIVASNSQRFDATYE
jgi:hypothetical protein